MPQETLSGLLTCFIRYIFIAFVIGVVIFLTLPQRSAVIRPDHCYDKAAVATDSGTCSTIGKDILKRGGSAVDAAIAALLCLSVMNPQSMGIGGGVVFVIYNSSSGTVETINARETAPKNASADMFASASQETKPGLLIAVPGELRGYEMAHRNHGRLPWKELFEPSIKLALKGVPIGKALANAIQEEKEKILKNAALREVFCDSNNETLKENDIIRFPQLAFTYRKIARYGANAFYSGSLSQTIVDDIKAAGGIVTREDLKGYKPEWKKSALNFTVGKYTFYAPDAPFGGPVLALILNILLASGPKGYNLSSESISTKEKRTLTYHRIIEAFCFANAEKSRLGDPLHEKIVNEYVKTMMSESYAKNIRSQIKDDIAQACSKLKNGKVPEDHGTSHMAIMDEEGNAVSVTSSINDYFGSGVMSDFTGIIFNNQMNDFLIPESISRPSENNKIKPGKRPLSSMCPTIILDNNRKVKMVVGGEGGTNITTSVAQVILNNLIFGFDLRKAVDYPRINITPNATYVEIKAEFPEFMDVIGGLKQKNHHIFNNAEISLIQAIEHKNYKICAKSDDRKGGYPDGY